MSTTKDRRLPLAVQDLAARLGAGRNAAENRVELRQKGRMRQTQTGSWMAFRARQSISTVHCQFDWLARAGPFGVISAHDCLRPTDGGLDVYALGIFPLMRAAHTPQLLRGQRMRYLAELALAPDAIVGNLELRWREEGSDRLVVSVGDGQTMAEVALTLDSQGRIASAFAPDRPRSVTPPFQLTPWRGRFSDYRNHNGKWLPFGAEVSWQIDGKEFVYWQGTILTSLVVSER